MSFETQIAIEPAQITTLLRLRPRLRAQSWVDLAVPGENVWSLSWTRGTPISVTDVGFYPASVNGMPYTELEEVETYADCEADKGTYFYDEDTQTIFANFLDLGIGPTLESASPNGRIVYVEWDIYYATERLNWFSDPTNSGSGDQVWEGGLQKPPIPQQGNPDLLFGFSPIRATDIQIIVADGDLMDILNDWSIRSSLVKVWECAGKLATGNISEVFTGVAGNYNMVQGVLSISVSDPMEVIDQAIETQQASVSDYPNLDPSKEGAEIRRVFGLINGFVPINITFDDTPSTTGNRTWLVSQEQANKAQLTLNVVSGSPSNTTDYTKLVTASGLRAGDSVILLCSGVAKYVNLIEVDYVTNIIRHTFILGRTDAPGDTVQRGFISRLTIGDGEGNAYSLSYGRDWTEVDLPNDTKGFQLADNFEASIPGFPAPFDPSTMTPYLSVYGTTLVPKKLDGITDFCTVAQAGGMLANPIAILWQILRTEVRIFRQLVTFDEAAWFALASSIERGIGVALPEESGGRSGSWKEIIQEILQSELLRLHIRINGGFAELTITRDGPTGTAASVVDQNTVSSWNWSWGYSDTYAVVNYEYNHREYDEGFHWVESQSIISPVNNMALYFHRSEQEIDVKGLHYDDDDAGEVANQLSAIFGERRAALIGVIPPREMLLNIGDTVTVGSKFLPGAAVDGNLSERDFKLTQHAKSPQGITVTLEDQKGVENFQGDWTP